jgi:DNA processing protein
VFGMSRSPDDIDDATLRLLLAPGIGPATIRKLRDHFGSDRAAIEASIAQLSALEGIGRTTAAEMRRSLDDTDPERERESMMQRGVGLLLRDDPEYPAMLAVLADAPEALWVRGSLDETDRLAIALVGSRRCTSYGREQAGRFGALLAQSGLTIVSGGALGIDGEAHRGALRVGGRTIAVLGCGLAVDYPDRHADLFHRIAEGGGAVLSEYPMHAPPLAQNFPRRNRIISGLALGVLVIEAARRSGALITARLAAEEHGREVMALPGRVDSPASAGCLKLIRDGGAALIRDHADVLEQLDASTYDTRGLLEAAGLPHATRAATLFDAALTDGQAAVVRVLEESGSAVLLDQLAAQTQRPMQELMADLTLLEIRGRIERDRRGIRLRRQP